MEILLCGAMLFRMSDGPIASALEDPANEIVLTVPESLQDGGSCFVLTGDCYQFWQVLSAEDNNLRVPQEDLRYFDRTTGLFEGLTSIRPIDGYVHFDVLPSVVAKVLMAFDRQTANTAQETYKNPPA